MSSTKTAIAVAAVSSVWAALQRRRFGLGSKTLTSIVPNDGFHARLAAYEFLASRCAGRTVLDLVPHTGEGCSALLVRGAKEVVATSRRSAECRLGGPSSLEIVPSTDDLAERRFDLVAAIDSPESPLRPSDLEHGRALLAPQGRLVVATGQWAMGANWPQRFSVLAGGRDRRPLPIVERWAQLAPPGYTPDWRRQLPARARSLEYRFSQLGLHDHQAPVQAIGEFRVLGAVTPVAHPRLHVGCGLERLPDWVNIDLEPLPGVDLVLDVTRGLPFSVADAVYAEHFLEHLSAPNALAFLRESHRALRDGGRLRLSTPNLDWVWATHYSFQGSDQERVNSAFRLNRAFYGWQHQFLWNQPLLAAALTACGFEAIQFTSYGKSRWPDMSGLERHERYHDVEDLPHVLVVEAEKGTVDEDLAAQFELELKRRYADQLGQWDLVGPVTQTPRSRPE